MTEPSITEWYDDTDPPERGIRLQEEDTSLPWSALTPGLRVRWKTQTFVKRGTIIYVRKRTMVVHFDAHAENTVIPDAKWYFVEGKVGNLNEHLVTISTPAPEQSLAVQKLGDDAGDYVSPTEAASILGTDAKNIRRKIRNGTLKAERQGGRWVILRDELQ